MSKKEFCGINISWSQYPNGVPFGPLDEYVKNLLKMLVDEEDWQSQEPNDFEDLEKMINDENAVFEEMVRLEVIDSMVIGDQPDALNLIMQAYNKNNQG